MRSRGYYSSIRGRDGGRSRRSPVGLEAVRTREAYVQDPEPPARWSTLRRPQVSGVLRLLTCHSLPASATTGARTVCRPGGAGPSAARAPPAPKTRPGGARIRHGASPTAKAGVLV